MMIVPEEVVDFDEERVYLYKNKLYMRLTINGFLFFEIKYDSKVNSLVVGAYKKFDWDELKELVCLPNKAEVIMYYVNQKD